MPRIFNKVDLPEPDDPIMAYKFTLLNFHVDAFKYRKRSVSDLVGFGDLFKLYHTSWFNVLNLLIILCQKQDYLILRGPAYISGKQRKKLFTFEHPPCAISRRKVRILCKYKY